MKEVLYATRIRNAELRGLPVRDADLARGVVQIRNGKNGMDRLVPLGRAASPVQREYLQETRPQLLGRRGPAVLLIRGFLVHDETLRESLNLFLGGSILCRPLGLTAGTRMTRFAGPIIALCAVIALPVPALAEHQSCQPTPELRVALSELDPRAVDNCAPNDRCWLALIDSARSLAKDHPQDLHAQRIYQNLVHWWVGEDREAKVEQMLAPYKNRATRHPDEPVALYLVARFYDTLKEGVDSATRLVEVAPDFPWGHTALAAVLWSVSREEANPGLGAQADEHLETFMRLCPSRFQEPLTLQRPGGDPEFLRPHLARFREGIAASAVPTRLAYLPSLWRADFKASSPEQHQEVRDRLRHDLASIAKLDREENVRWLEVMLEGHEMTDDQAAVESLSLKLAEAFPCHWRAVKARHDQMTAMMGRRSMEDFSQEEIRQIYATASDWLAACPEEFSFQLVRFNAVRHREDLSNRELIVEADRLLQAWDDTKQKFISYHGPNYEVAQLLLERNLEVDRVPRLVELEIREQQGQWDKQPLEDLPESMRDTVRMSREIVDIENQLLLAEAHLRLGHERKAERILSESEARLIAAPSDNGSAIGRVDSQKARIWGLKGALAESKGRLPDAFACYRRAAGLDPDREWEQESADVWHEMGGSLEGLATLIDSTPSAEGDERLVADPSAWEEANTPMKPFGLVDLRGRSWGLDNLVGGTVLINVWSTWCGPCRIELPHLQELYERLEQRDDVRILSINVDYNPGLVAPFADRLHLTFPILLGERYFYDDSPMATTGIPQNWIVDAGGVIRWKSLGFPADRPEGWVDETYQLLKRVAAENGNPPLEPPR
jgi:thiol-disulfide isomerase/thioredoxin